MAQTRAAINLGDLAQALTALKPNSARDEKSLILKCLGLSHETSNTQEGNYRQRGAWQRNSSQKNQDTPEIAPQAEHKPAMPPAPEPPPATEGNPLPIKIEDLGKPDQEQHIPQPEGENPPPLGSNTRTIPQHKRKNLFPDHQARGLITAATAQKTEGYSLDIPRLIKASIQRDTLHSLPVLSRATNRNGCQLLLDFSDALMPWWEDMRGLIQQTHSVLGEANCPIYEFDYAPLEAIRWTESKEIPWQGVANKPVLLATDFGITRYARHTIRPSFAIWREFALHCRKQRSPIIALTPISRHRAPQLFGKLGKLMTVIEWHPKIKATDIQRTVAHVQGQRL